MTKVLALAVPLAGIALASGQVTKISVQITDQNEKTVTYRVTNNSDKPLTCYSVAVDVMYSDGTVNQSQESKCQYGTKGIVGAQASMEQQGYLSPSSHGAIAKVEVEPTLAVFQDGSSEKRDVKSWHILMDSVKSNFEGERDVISALQSNSDPAKAASTLETLRQKAAPGSPYENRLKEAITYLKTNPSPAELKAYLAHVQEGYELHKPYADLRGDQK